ncbi:MAG: aldehyde dehydrogenase family protein [Rickettsiales endosymbiont of Dermacentor nuttalli]
MTYNDILITMSEAFNIWKKYTAKERAKILRKWYELVILHKNDLAIIMTAKQGKPVD